MTAFSEKTLQSIRYAGELFRNARNAIALTGAGISTPSGIPDFRSEGSGLWASEERMQVASMTTFRTNPEQFFNWFRPLASQIYKAEPNPAHLALAEFEKIGVLHHILTQNIDNLHHKAGSQQVLELHGTIRTLSCTSCFQKFDHKGFLPSYIEYGRVPHCPDCRAILKPDVILFGEQLPQTAWFEAQRVSRSCDLMLVAGSSLEVLPVAGLPMQTIDRGGHLIIINQSPTYIDVRADLVIREDVAEVIPAIVKQLIK